MTLYHRCFCPSSWRWAVTSSRAPWGTCWTHWSRALHRHLGLQRKWFSKEIHRLLVLLPCLASSRFLLTLRLHISASRWQNNADMLPYSIDSLPVYRASNHPSLFCLFMSSAFLFALNSCFLLKTDHLKWIIEWNRNTSGWEGLFEKRPACVFHILLSHKCTARENSVTSPHRFHPLSHTICDCHPWARQECKSIWPAEVGPSPPGLSQQ